MLYSEFDFFQTNIDNYLSIKNHFNQLKLQKKERFFFFYNLNELLKIYFPDNKDENITGVRFKTLCHIRILYNEISKQLYHGASTRDTFNFDETKRHLATLPTTQEKLKYLLRIKTAYNQNKPMLELLEINEDENFAEKCNYEIEMLKEMQQQENLPKAQNSPVVSTPIPKPIKPIQLDMEQRQIIYLFQQLIDERFLNETKNPTLWDLVAQYFTDKDGKALKNIHQNKDGLKNTKTGNPQKDADKIEAIVQQCAKPVE